MIAALRKRWSLDNFEITKPPLLVTFFDPRFKGLKFLSESQRKTLIDHVTMLVNESIVNKDNNEEDLDESEVAIPRKKTALDIQFSCLFKTAWTLEYDCM